MKKSNNKNEDKEVLNIKGMPVRSLYNMINKSEEVQWQEIEIKLAELKTPNEKLAFLHKRLAEYYQNLPEPTLNASGQILNQFPHLGKQFLDRKIQAEIDFTKSEQLRRRENMIFKKSLKRFSKEIIEENLMSPEVLQNRTKILLMEKLGILEELKKFDQLKTIAKLSQFLAELFENNQEKKKSTAKSIKTDLTYINTNDKKNPKNQKSLKTRNAILVKYGFPFDHED